METLHDIAVRHGTDKAAPRRSLAALYGRIFEARRSDPVALLEIGVLAGASLRMWRDYFASGRIYGIDRDVNAKRHEDDRIRIFIGEQADAEFLDSVVSRTGPLDIIVDDGGHRAAQQIGSLVHLWTYLLPGGTYIVEDTHTSYLPAFDMSWRQDGTTIEFLKGLVDDVHTDWHDAPAQLGAVEALSFYAETCVIVKRATSEAVEFPLQSQGRRDP